MNEPVHVLGTVEAEEVQVLVYIMIYSAHSWFKQQEEDLNYPRLNKPGYCVIYATNG